MVNGRRSGIPQQPRSGAFVYDLSDSASVTMQRQALQSTFKDYPNQSVKLVHLWSVR